LCSFKSRLLACLNVWSFPVFSEFQSGCAVIIGESSEKLQAQKMGLLQQPATAALPSQRQQPGDEPRNLMRLEGVCTTAANTGEIKLLDEKPRVADRRNVVRAG
jgi:hypothetical protein